MTYEVTAGSTASSGMKFSALLAMRLRGAAVPRVPTKAGTQAAASKGSSGRRGAMVNWELEPKRSDGFGATGW